MDVRDFFSSSLCLILAAWEENYSNCLYYGWKTQDQLSFWVRIWNANHTGTS